MDDTVFQHYARKESMRMQAIMKGAAVLAVSLVLLALPSQGYPYDVIKVTDGGTISGRVTFKGTPPTNTRKLITKDFDICGKGEREIPEVVVSKDGGLQETVVFIRKVDKGKAWAKPKGEEFLLDQKGCRFIPYLQIIPRDETLVVQNSDPVLHNIHVRELIGRARRTMFNFGQPKQGQRVPKKIHTIRSNNIKVECEAHDFMHGWMFAAKNPYYAVTKPDGSFSIDQVPPGEYAIHAWHPNLGTKKSKVAVPPAGKADVNFEFSE
jgi:hypothetical protein